LQEKASVQAFLVVVSVLLLCLLIFFVFSNFSLKKKNSTLVASLVKYPLQNVEAEPNDISQLRELQNDELLLLKKELQQLKTHFDEQVLSKTGELQTALEKSRESNKLKDAFLEKISREIRTPLNSILGFINLLNDPYLSKIDREYYLKFIRESGNSLLILIDNIVDYSRLETGEVTIEHKKCNLNQLLSELVDRYRTRFLRERPNLTLIYNQPDEERESFVDCKRILHIIDQLLNNAFKFTSEGKVELDYKIADGFHMFIVSDNGIGIESKFHDIIFESFYQISPDKQNAIRGAGLGLTIAKRITDFLDGTLTLESKIGAGTTFTLKIPHKETVLYIPHQTIQEKNFDWGDKTILIAEDEDTNFFLLQAVLKKTKANIIRADDGVKFLEIINERKNIDLILLDIKMPGINGFNAVKVIRQQNINIPVIAQTAFNQPEDKQRCLQSGCNDYLAKPINKELLISKISQYFN
jgi:signal transduction histidine kinase/CheY-like chemotaxis protein